MIDIKKDITAVTINWLTARRTLGAIQNFKKYYPDVPLMVVDDASNEKDKSEFFAAYNGHDVNPELEYDPDTDKLKNIPGVEFVQAPDFGVHPKSTGYVTDIAIQKMPTRWMFNFHSDYRMTSGGIIEELIEGLDETYAGAGDSKTRHERCPCLLSVAAIYNAEAGRKHDVTFRPVIYYNDDTISDYPGQVDPNREGGIAVEAGSYYVAKLIQLGYKVKWMNSPHSKYGVHLRWGNPRWNELY